jgi:tetratricopeptide (TPR) repeat protein
MLQRFGFAIAATMFLATPASADWVEATSRHFVVYSEDSPANVRAFTEKLERFDKAVRIARKMADPDRSPAVKVVVYQVKDLAAVQRLYPGNGRGVGGFYNPIVQGPYSVVPRSTGQLRDYGMDADSILFHEYAHHLQLSDLNQPMPRWLADGFAEFYATAEFNKDGSVRLGKPLRSRDKQKEWGAFLPLEVMLADEAKGDQEATIYLLGWALTHYLTFDPSRKGQLEGFLADSARGMAPLAAAQKNFGSIGKLNTDVNAHIRKAALPVVDIQPHVFKDIAVNVRTLSPAENAILPWRMESKVGVDKDEAPKVAAGARAVAARFPNDPLVLASLAEAELDVKNYAAARSAAERLLAIQPTNVEGLIYKGRALTELGALEKDAAKKEELFKQSRAAFIAANRVDKEDPEPLYYFYDSYVKQGIPASNNAKTAIHYAADLMPQDSDVRMQSVVQYMRDNKLAEARQALVPIAYSAHGGEGAKRAKEMMAKLAAGDGKAALAIYEKAKAEAEAKEKKGK